jgi:integrase
MKKKRFAVEQIVAILKQAEMGLLAFAQTAREVDRAVLVLDVAILHRVFAFALDNEMITKNPVRMEGIPGENPQNGAEPFNNEDLSRLRDHLGDDLLAFLLLRWTGLRGGDAVTMTWGEVHLNT